LLLAAALILGAVPAGAESWRDSLSITPITTPIDLRYRPVARATFTFGQVAIEQVGMRLPTPVARSVETIRIEAVAGRLAVTFEADTPGQGHGMTARLLISPKGEFLDAVLADESGAPEEKDGPFLAQLEQSMFLTLPRFPDHPVKTGDILYSPELDSGFDIGLGSGQLPLKVTGIVRGTTMYDGRQAVVVDFTTEGRCTCGPVTLSEQGYELIDVATGIVLALTSETLLKGPDGHVRWTNGVQTQFR
jgi:hypothetical protein